MRSKAEVESVLDLRNAGLNLREISLRTGIPWSTVQRWASGEVPSRKTTCCPLCTESPLDPETYSYVLGIYLGDGALIARPRDVYRFEVWQDQRYSGIVAEVAQAISRVKGSGESAGIRFAQGCAVISSSWKHWPCLFPQHGPGKKHERKIQLVDWQEEVVRSYPAKLLRGLIQSDGWRGTNKVTRMVNGSRKQYLYPQYQFTNHSMDIQEIFRWACDLFGVHWRQMTWRTLCVSRREDVEKLDRVIGTKA